MNVRIEQSWKELLRSQWDNPEFEKLTRFVRERYAAARVFPPAGQIFAAFDHLPVDDVKVVILGQDPYHGAGQANGLCFSVNSDVPLPPSLKNIFKEIASDTGVVPYANGDLTRWARQGVLLLNATLTVEEGRPGSHQGHGWEEFTDYVISQLSSKYNNIVFMLWGSYAINKGRVIDTSKHLVLTSRHPSPLSAHSGFFGNHHFSRANEYLKAHGKTEIDWR